MSFRDQGQRPTFLRLSSSMARMTTLRDGGRAPEAEFQIVELEFEELA